MIDERRYGEEEVAEILDRATAPDHDLSRLAGQTGLTLDEIQEIGSEAGISPRRIAQAALVVAHPRAPDKGAKTLLGAPRSVERVVHLERALSDEEWSRLVAELRETFDAEGALESHGTLRSWRNGHLQVHLEPIGDGYRVRMQTLHGDSAGMIGLGVGGVITGLLFLLLTSSPKMTGGEDVVFGALAALLGMGAIAVPVWMRFKLPQWAALREAQFEQIARRLPLMLNP